MLYKYYEVVSLQINLRPVYVKIKYVQIKPTIATRSLEYAQR